MAQQVRFHSNAEKIPSVAAPNRVNFPAGDAPASTPSSPTAAARQPKYGLRKQHRFAAAVQPPTSGPA